MLKSLCSQDSGIVAGEYRGIPFQWLWTLSEMTEDLRPGDPVPSCGLHLTHFAVWARSLHVSWTSLPISKTGEVMLLLKALGNSGKFLWKYSRVGDAVKHEPGTFCATVLAHRAKTLYLHRCAACSEDSFLLQSLLLAFKWVDRVRSCLYFNAAVLQMERWKRWGLGRCSYS